MQEETSQLQFCRIQFKDLLQRARQCKIKIVGMIKSVFSTKKYIVQVYIEDQIYIRTVRRYNQFEATYEVIKMKFQNFDLGQFPSKFQVFGKDQTRKQYLQWLMNRIVENYNQNPQNQASKRLLSIVYLLLTRSLVHQNQPKLQARDQSQISMTFEKKRKLSLNQPATSYSEHQEAQQQYLSKSLQSSAKKHKSLTQYQVQRQRVRRNSEGSMIEFSDQDECQHQNDKHQNPNDKHQCSNDKRQYSNEGQNQEGVGQSGKNSQKTVEAGTKPLKKVYKRQGKDFNFQIRFQKQKEWKRRYLKIQNSSLMILRDKMQNHFRTKVQLYRIQVEFFHRQKNTFEHFCQKMQINNQITLSQDESIIALSHEYDHQKLLIRGLCFDSQQKETSTQKSRLFAQLQRVKLQRLRGELQRASQHSPIQQKFEGVFDPIGKVFLVIHRFFIKNIDQSQRNILKINIRTNSLEYQCKKVLVKEENLIKQGFFIPISSSFQTVTIEVMISREQGWIRQQFKDFNLGYFPIQFSQILTKPSGYKFQKINVALIKPAQPTHQFSDSQANVQYSLENYSHFSSIYSQSFASENDGRIISGLKLEDMDQLSVTVDRALRIIGNVGLFITCFWRNVYLFKYPRLSRTFFAILFLLALFAQVKVFIIIGFVILVTTILYNQPQINKPLKLLIEYLFFCDIHPNFVRPLCLGTSQIKYRKWCQALDEISKEFHLTKENKMQKKQNLPKQNYIQFKFEVHQKTFRVADEVKGILGKMFQGKRIVQVVSRMISGVVNSIQKFFNLFLWVDAKRTCLLLFILIVFSGVANDFLVRLIGSIFCLHRLYKGMSFYRVKHYQRNRKTALYTLKYILKKYFPNLLSSQLNLFLEQQKKAESKKSFKNFKDLKYQSQLDRVISQIQFPLGDQSACKKLNAELQKLISVYLDLDEIRQAKSLANGLLVSQKSQKSLDKTTRPQKQQAKNSNLQIKDKNLTIAISQVINIIESCQTRLSIDWVPGKQGLSNQFQQLISQTKQTLLLDVWLEHLLINFILNIPSQMFVQLKNSQAKTEQAKKQLKTN